MFIRCRGNCGKIRSAHPYKSTRLVEYLCTSCAQKYATPVKVVDVKTQARFRAVSMLILKQNRKAV